MIVSSTFSISHYFHRTQIRLPLASFSILFQLPKPCRCLCWDHASSLAFETIRLNSWPTPTRELPWLQLLSRSAYKFQLAVVYSVGDARVVHTRWVPYGKRINFVWFRSSSYRFIASNTVFRSMYIITIGHNLWLVPSQAIFDVLNFCAFLKLLDLRWTTIYWRSRNATESIVPLSTDGTGNVVLARYQRHQIPSSSAWGSLASGKVHIT